MKEIGVAEDNFGHFISEVYRATDLQREHIAYNVKRGKASTAIQAELQNLTADKGTLQKVSRGNHIFNSFRNFGFHNFLRHKGELYRYASILTVYKLMDKVYIL